MDHKTAKKLFLCLGAAMVVLEVVFLILSSDKVINGEFGTGAVEPIINAINKALNINIIIL